MSSSGSDDTSTNSVTAIVTSFVYNGAFAGIFIVAFVLLRPWNRPVYEKRVTTDIARDDAKPRAPPTGYFAWIPDLLSRKDPEIIRDVGMDGYFFLRFLRTMGLICIFGILFLGVLLMPIHGTGGGGNTGLNILTFGNVLTPENNNRFYAHAFAAWIFFGFVLFCIYRELLFYVSCRQAFLTSNQYRTRISSRTVLVNGVSEEQMSESYFRSIYDGVKNVALARDAKELTKLVKERTALAGKVEASENKMLSKSLKKRCKLVKKNKELPGDNLEDYLKKPVTHRLKKWGLPIGKKVETISFAKERMPELNQEITTMQNNRKEAKPLRAAFVTFTSQRHAEVAYQSLAHPQPFHLAPRFIGMTPDEVLWENLDLSWWRRLVQSLGANTISFALCVFWCIPVAFVGFISQINVIIDILDPAFNWINNLPKPLFGLISSMLPAILLAVLMSLLPPFIRWMGRVSGCGTATDVEFFLQQVYFTFLVIQNFFIVTLSSSILSTLSTLLADGADVKSLILNTLSKDLPKASNFFLNYILLQALTIPSGAILQISAVLLFHALGMLLDNTPRKRWERRNLLGLPGWGVVFPLYSLFSTIIFSYAMLAPLMFAFGIVLYFLVYFVFLNNLTYVNGVSNGRGIYYSRALFQMFTGIYVALFCLVVMLVFAKAWGPVVISAILALFVIYVQIHLERAFNSLLFSLPRALLEKNNPTLAINRNSDPYAEKGHSLDVEGHSLDVGKYEKHSDSAGLIERQVSTNYERGTLMQRFFKPHIYYRCDVLRQHLFTDPVWSIIPEPIAEELEEDAYYDPAFNNGNPVVWFPADEYGWADKQMTELRKSDINAYNTGAWYEEKKNKVKFETTETIGLIPVYDAGESM